MRGVNAATKTVIAMVDLRKGETSMVGQWDKHTSSQHVSQLKRRHVWQRLSGSRFSIFFQPSFRKLFTRVHNGAFHRAETNYLVPR